MKIEIEFTGTTEAKITIDGRFMKYGYDGKQGVWRFKEGIKPDEFENTIGGMIASKLVSPIIDILQGHMPEYDNPNGECWGAWEKLDERSADEVYEKINP